MPSPPKPRPPPKPRCANPSATEASVIAPAVTIASATRVRRLAENDLESIMPDMGLPPTGSARHLRACAKVPFRLLANAMPAASGRQALNHHRLLGRFLADEAHRLLVLKLLDQAREVFLRH